MDRWLTARVLTAGVGAALVLSTLTAPVAAGSSVAGAAAGVAPEVGGASFVQSVSVLSPDRRPRPGRTRVVQAGPASPLSPEVDSYFFRLQHGQCADLLAALRPQLEQAQDPDPVVLLFSSLADLCLGARSKAYQSDWVVAQRAYEASAGLDDCLSVAARDGLRRALANRDETGSARPDFRPPPTGTACEPQPTFVGLVQDSPDAPAALIVLGLRLFEANGVRVDGVWHPATSRNAIDGTECAQVAVLGFTPPATGSTVTVRVRGNGYRTPTSTWIVGPTLTPDDVLSLDEDLCAPIAGTSP
ncbi:MAG: hypothetical protein IPO93_04680 [Actinobacteria bacterium]|jgi:hypothetical protein|nr:hypothetical protein [Actinomycetota bacterium]